MSVEQIVAELAQPEGQSYQFVIPESWGQGRALFGGMAAAVAFKYLAAMLPAESLVRAISVSFIAPIAPGPVVLKREILRVGKSVQHAEVRIYQQDQIALVLLASFGASRASTIRHQPAPIQTDIAVSMDFPKRGPVPEFTKHFDYQLMQGGLPFSGQQALILLGRNRLAEQSLEPKCTVAELLALIDAWPPATLSWLSAPAPASSLTWSLEFIRHDWQASANDWWYYRATIDAAEEGYSHIGAEIFDDAGQLIAISRQTVTVFA